MNTLHLNQIGDKVTVKKGEGGGEHVYKPQYFSVDWSLIDETMKNLFTSDSLPYTAMRLFSTSKIIADDVRFITTVTEYARVQVAAFSYLPVGMKGDDGQSHIFTTFEVALGYINELLAQGGINAATMNGITEITEEEFYTL